MKKRAVLYTRVSTEDQAEHGYSLPTQLEGCRNYALSNEFQIVGELADDCSGTVPIIERGKGSKLYEMVNDGMVDVVILYTHDRTARDEKVIEYLLFKSFLYERNVELHYSDTGLDPYTMEGNLIGYIKAHAAADERRKIRERNMRGKIAKVRSGKWIGQNPPYGYQKVGNGREAILEINPETALIVQRIYAMYLGHDGYKPHNMLGIAVKLTTEKVPHPGNGRKSARGWTDGTIRYILTNTAYIGEFRYKDVTVSLPDLAILPRDIWEAAQARRQQNINIARRSRKYDYLLSGGYFHCVCGCTMVCRTVYGGNTRYYYYACSNQRRRYLYGCEEKLVRADIADRMVWEWVYNLLIDEASLDAGIKRMIEKNELDLSPKRERLEAVKRLLQDSERQVRRLATAYGEADNDEVAAALKIELKNAGKRLDGLKDEKQRLEAEIGLSELLPEEIVAIKKIAAELRTKLGEATFETQRLMIDQLRLRVELRRDAEDNRWLDISCGIIAESESLLLPRSPLSRVTIFELCKNCWVIRM